MRVIPEWIDVLVTSMILLVFWVAAIAAFALLWFFYTHCAAHHPLRIDSRLNWFRSFHVTMITQGVGHP